MAGTQTRARAVDGADTPDGLRAVTISLGKRLGGPNRDASLLFGATLTLVIAGLVMVLSSSAVEEFTAGNSVSDKFVKQLLFAALGIPVMFIASRVPPQFWMRVSWPMLGVATVLQLLVLTPLGVEIAGNRAWLNLGGFQFQPAELLKIALVLWLADLLARKSSLLHEWKHAAIPILPVLGVSLGAAIASKDLGTTMVLGVLVLGALFCGGFPMRYLAFGGLLALGGVLLFTAISPNRMARIGAFFSGQCDYEQLCWQSTHGLYALAAGGLFGVGLGNSQAKWSWLPEADNDFIFAIIGEELGLVGALVIMGLFVMLTWVMVRMVIRTDDVRAKTVIGGVAVWLVFQASVNIAVVVGLLPVLGVPLPLVSSGGSALLTTLLAIGIVVSMSRTKSPPIAPTSKRPSGQRR